MDTESYAPTTILIVAQNAETIHLLETCLYDAGYRVLTARTGELGVRRARFSRPDLIVLAVRMPGIDGFEVCRHLKATPETHAIPIIFLADTPDEAGKVRGFEAGGVDYIVQPAPGAEILARINVHLSIQQAQHALHASEARYRAVVEDQAALVCRLRPDGRLTFVNPACCRLFGASADDLLGQNLFQLLPDHERQQTVQVLERLSQANPIGVLDQQMQGSDGLLHWIQWTIRLVCNRHGILIEFQAVGCDITERVQAEAAYRTLVEQSLQGLIVVQGERIVFSNSTAAQICGYSISELLQLSSPALWDLVHPDDRALVQQRYGQRTHDQRDDVPPQCEFRFLRHDSTVRWLECAISFITFHNAPAIQMAFLDVTERKAAAEQLSRRHDEMLLLNRLSARLLSAQSLGEAFAISQQALGDLFADSSGALYVLSSETHLLERVCFWGKRPPTEIALRGTVCPMLTQCHGNALEVPLLHAHDGCPLDCLHALLVRDQGALCTPLIASGERVGLLYVRSTKQPAHSDREAWEGVALAAADVCALAVANLRLREQLHAQAIHDSLTGLFNRRYLGEMFPYLLEDACRRQQRVGLIMLDIDYFKHINDTFGHDAGDVVLRDLGAFLQQQWNGIGTAYRLGGEELLLVAEYTAPALVLQQAEQIRQGVGSLQVQYHGHLLPSITVSAGVAWAPEHGVTFTELLLAADNALYVAKSQGRNCVRAAGPAAAPPLTSAAR